MAKTFTLIENALGNIYIKATANFVLLSSRLCNDQKLCRALTLSLIRGASIF